MFNYEHFEWWYFSPQFRYARHVHLGDIPDEDAYFAYYGL